MAYEGEQTSFDLVQRTDADGVATLTLNAPRSINALSEAMMSALSAKLDAIAEDRSVKVVILRSAGDHFCAGHNLMEMTKRRSDADGGFKYFQDLFATCSAMMLRAELERSANEMARIVAGKSPVAIRTGKRAYYRQAEMALEEAYAYTGRVMAENMMARDTEAGIDAFTRKHPMPEWTGE